MVLNRDGQLKIEWPGVAEAPLFEEMNRALLAHTRVLGGTYLENFRWTFLGGRNLMTAHPLGGCPLGEDSDHGVVDDQGRVFDGRGGIHQGLYVVDGAIIPTALGVNPLLTISALAESIAERMPQSLAS